jgi:hypothetical protein
LEPKVDEFKSSNASVDFKQPCTGAISFQPTERSIDALPEYRIFLNFDILTLNIIEKIEQVDYIIHYRGTRTLFPAIKEESHKEWFDRLVRVLEPKIKDEDKPRWLKQKLDNKILELEKRIGNLEQRLAKRK